MRKLLLIAACLLPLAALAGTNELAPPNWVTEDHLVPAAENLQAGPDGRYSVPVREILAPHADRTDNPHSVTLQQLGVSADGEQIVGATFAQIRTLLNVPADATNDYLQLNNRPILGDAASKNVGTSAGTVAAGDHTQAASTISDSTAAGRSLLTAADAAAQRTLLNTDQVTDTRDPKSHQHPAADLSDATAWGRSFIQAVDAGAGMSLLGFSAGYGVGQHPPLQALGPCTPLGVCTDGVSTTEYACEGNAGTWTPYDSAALCAAAGGSWGSAVGFKFSSASFPQGGLFVGDLEVVPGSASWAAIPDKPATFPPDAHSHEQTDITGLVARLVTLETQVSELDASLALAGYPDLTIDQTSPVEFTTASTTLTGTATDNNSVASLEYQIDGGAWVNITPLQSPWSLTVNSGSLTPNVASTVNIRATDNTALSRTKSISLTYQTPVLSITPASHIFADTDTGGSSPTQQFVVNNTGQATGNLGTFAKGGTDPGQFGLSGGNCTSTLAPGASCIAGNVVFSPTTAGAKSATLTDGTLTASLSGTGVDSSLFAWSMESATFPQTSQVGGVQIRVGLTNTGSVVAGAVGNGLSQNDAVHTYWRIPNSTVPTNAGKITMWVKHQYASSSSDANIRHFFITDIASGAASTINASYQASTDIFQFSIYDAAGTQHRILSTTATWDNTSWYKYEFLWNATAGTMSILRDGVTLAGSSGLNMTPWASNLPNWSAVDFKIGGTYPVGVIDEFTIE